MPTFEFKLPDIGEGVTEGEVVAWNVQQGDQVSEDEPMVEVMTDKATVTIGAPKTGTILELRAGVGETVAVGSVLVVFDLGGARSAPSTDETSGEGPAATAVGDIRESLPGMGPAVPTAKSKAPTSEPQPAEQPLVAVPARQDYFCAKPLATPATRKLARDRGVDLCCVPPTGPKGRVTKADVLAFVAGPISSPSPAGGVPADKRVPFVGLRRRIAARMQHTKNTAAHFTFVEECDATALKAMRARLKPAAEEAGVKLTFLPFIVKAVVAALRKHPLLNSRLDEDAGELVYQGAHHIGIATATEQGLVVPVLRDAGSRSLLDVGKEIERLAAGARAGSLSTTELSGSTFTITSLGVQGGLLATPILNHPEVGILGVHRMKQRPVVRDGEIVIGEVMNLSLSFDHRIIDGHVGAAFAYDVLRYLEHPELFVLDVV